MDQILNTILKDTYTLSSLKHRLNVLKTYVIQKLFGNGLPKNQGQLEEIDLEWLKSLSPAFFQNFNKDSAYQLMSQLEKVINQLKTLTIYLAFETDNNSLISIGKYVRKTYTQLGTTSNTGLPVLLDINYDTFLIAGAALSWNGFYKDFSLSSVIAEKKQLILDSFRKYLR